MSFVRQGQCLGRVPLTPAMARAFSRGETVWALPFGDDDYMSWLSQHDLPPSFPIPAEAEIRVLGGIPHALFGRRCRQLRVDGGCAL